MSREQIYAEIKDQLGVVPDMFNHIPDDSLALEWQLFRKVQLEEGAVPNKYRELIGLGISAVTKCKYCLFSHTEMARLHGATDAKIEDAVHFAKSSAGWSTYLTGLQIDFEQFRREVRQVCDHVRSRQLAKV